MKKDVLDHGYVELIESWGSDERVIEAARMSTAKGFVGWGTPEQPGDEKLLKFLWQHKHYTPFEMAGLVLEVKAPIFVFREWHRHRTQSYNEMSARYIPLPDENYRPAAIGLQLRSQEAADAANKQARSAVPRVVSYEEADEWLRQLDCYYELVQDLYQSGLALGIPKEIARIPLPVARYSRMRASANLRNWLQFLTLRLAPQAQWEIRQFAQAVGQLVEQEFPRTYTLFREGMEHGSQ